MVTPSISDRRRYVANVRFVHRERPWRNRPGWRALPSRCLPLRTRFRTRDRLSNSAGSGRLL